jgi:hypothetical protein
MGKVSALFRLFRVGGVVANPAAWKAGQITVTALAPVIVALVAVARAYGVNVPISDDDAATLAGGIVVVVNVVLTLTTSARVGIGRTADGAGVDGAAATGTVARSEDRTDRARPDVPVVPPDGTTGVQHGGGVDPFADHGA